MGGECSEGKTKRETETDIYIEREGHRATRGRRYEREEERGGENGEASSEKEKGNEKERERKTHNAREERRTSREGR